MKHLKSKLLVAIAMLLFASIMMTTATYAWFTISTRPEIKDLKAQVVVNDNLEIALAKTPAEANYAFADIPVRAAVGDSDGSTDAGTHTDGCNTAAYTWGNVLHLAGVDAYSDDNLDKTLRPATLEAGAFKVPTYGKDGRVKSLESSTLTNTANGFGNIKGTDDQKIYGYYVDFWLRTNVGGTVSLSTKADRSEAGVEGDGSYLKAVAYHGDTKVTTLTDDEEAALQTLAENAKIAFMVLYDDAGANDINTVATVATTFADPDDGYKVAIDGNVVKLTANKAACVRMFVYLEGEEVTNAAASLLNKIDFTNALELNVQFKIDDGTKLVEHSMDAQS